MERRLLPIGSVVLLKEGQVRLMICGRLVTSGDGKEVYDYVACLYPQGVVSSKDLYFFNSDAVARIFFIGFQDPEEIAYEEEIAKLGELEVVDGRIVEKKDE